VGGWIAHPQQRGRGGYAERDTVRLRGHRRVGSSDAGSATSSAVDSPTGVAVDSGGDVYIANGGRNEVLKVTPSGTLSVFAGTGGSGAPTPGLATSSELSNPEEIAVDSSGNLYIANSASNDILKDTSGGTLSVFAGTGTPGAPTPGMATSSDLNGPDGVPVDSSGEVYISTSPTQRTSGRGGHAGRHPVDHPWYGHQRPADPRASDELQPGHHAGNHWTRGRRMSTAISSTRPMANVIAASWSLSGSELPTVSSDVMQPRA
jgi:hypothetical protein